jgi:next-to-BRCA1 protein 1
MASPAAAPVGPDTPITIKISIQGAQKKLKLPLSELVPGTLPTKVRLILLR